MPDRSGEPPGNLLWERLFPVTEYPPIGKGTFRYFDRASFCCRFYQGRPPVSIGGGNRLACEARTGSLGNNGFPQERKREIGMFVPFEPGVSEAYRFFRVMLMPAPAVKKSVSRLPSVVMALKKGVSAHRELTLWAQMRPPGRTNGNSFCR